MPRKAAVTLLSPSKARQEFAALEWMHEHCPADIVSDDIYDRACKTIQARLEAWIEAR